jgi:hypothetical protein
MVGDVVGGYVVKEALASGRSGLLFLAIQEATGHRAVVQRRLGDDDLQSFAREAAQVAGVEACLLVERRKSRAGVAVLLAIIDVEAPGSGYTDYTNTVPLPRLDDVAPRRRGRVLLGLAVLLLVGAALGALLLRTATRPPEATDVVPALPVTSVAAPPPAVTSAAAPAVTGVASPAVSPSPVAPPTPEPKAPSVQPSPDASAAKRKLAEAQPACATDDAWKRRASADLAELLQRAARHESLLRSAAEADEAISTRIGRAMSGADCRAVEESLRRLHGQVLAAETVCVPDERWRSDSRRSLSELQGRAAGNPKKFDLFEAREAQLSRDIASASTNSQCAGVEASLKKLLQDLNE